jgi:stage II sporulation protein R
MVLKRLFIFVAVVASIAGVVRMTEKPAAASTDVSISTTTHASANTSASTSGSAPTNAPARASTNPASELNIAEPHDEKIPNQALRLRIIANSDSPQDQQLKREVRDAVIVQVGDMLKDVKTEATAEQTVRSHLPDINSLAASVVKQHGFRYAVHAEVGQVPFPTKEYGNMVYPAGTYEALRIVIGSGQGQNWWCVLFPPLCFVDIASGDAVPNTGGFPDLPPLETIDIPTPAGTPEKVQVRVAALDYGEELLKGARHLIQK